MNSMPNTDQLNWDGWKSYIRNSRGYFD